jgi:GNAT superfamily N-acetyltransferase
VTTATKVTRLGSNQIGEAGEVLGRAFHEDPFWSWVLPGEAKRARVLPWFMEAWVRCCFGYGGVYTTANNMEGVAVWLPPGRSGTSLVRLILTGMVITPLKFGWAEFRRFKSSVNYLDKLRERAVPSRHWDLPTLGVDPSRQGQGVGSALLQPALALADADGLPCYLETEKQINVPFYNRHGFDVVVEVDLPKAGPHIWTMKREPRG